MSDVCFHRAGSGTPVVMVHGLGSRWQLFEPIIDAVAARHEVIAVDLPGFGATPPDPVIAPGPRGYASWLTGWLADQGISKPHVVGSSMGGGIALEMGRRGAASRVTAFSPIGFYGLPGRLWVQRFLTAARGIGTVAASPVRTALGTPPGRAALLGAFYGHPTRVAGDYARDDMARLVHAESFPQARDSFTEFVFRPGDDLGHLRQIPTTIAWGTRDAILIHRTQSAKAREIMPFARHIDLPGCGHLPFYDNPKLCADIVLDN
ncbi:MAG: alpha/beta hydrolase [Nocardiaceae bacterium]|nr:alpha/beta hydrolase [Nocardiaceae bacterium]